TRACLMTGRYNYRTRAIDTYIGRAMMEPDEITIAEVLGKAGYATGLFGKWHLGDSYPMRPQDQGFDEVLMHRGGGIGQPSDPPGGEDKYTDPILFRNGEKVQMQGYCTDIYFDEALDWMESVNQRDQNFFTYIATNAPHGPFHDVPEDLYQMYKEMDLSADEFPQEEGHEIENQIDSDRLARIYAMITNIDTNFGKLLDALDERGLSENTIVIFMIDNGPNGRRYVAGMRGAKSNVYEGGIRSPFYVRWPGRLQAGHSNDRIAAHIDIMPTLADACGAAIPQDRTIDGMSILPLLEGTADDWPDRQIVIQAHRGNKPVQFHNFALVTQKWKLLHASGFGNENFQGEPAFELYDLENDPLEMENVAAEHPEVLERLQQDYLEWFKDVSNTRPDNYAPPRIYIGTPHENPTVLTRQDWRHEKGQPWGRDSIGHWLLHAPEAGTYNITLRLQEERPAGEVTVQIGEQTISSQFESGQKRITLEKVEIPQGDLALRATLQLPEDTVGPWQVVVEDISN
ncbi:MAG: sulfatase-like hydrolase/transferase, partial [Candidatus Marinimicrobia bacterium]|nr:sulfatase-like hydrolase/transferase [Candidatus Neomarinimicrobiota bacterium]